jgi:DNA modification methylase
VTLTDVLLYKGDCLEEMKKIPDGSVDLVLTDPPYGTTACKWDSVIPFEPMWEQLHRVIKGNGAIVLFGSEPFSSALRMSNIKRYKYDWVWEKPHTGQLNAKRMPLKNIENIMVFYEFQPTYNPQFEHGEPYAIERKGYRGSECYGKQRDHSTISDGRRYPRQVLKYKHDKNRIHPTQKPVELLEYLIRTYTNPGDTVFDFTMGSGSTGVACVNTNRNFIGIELDADYFKIAEKRIEDARTKPLERIVRN